MTPPTAGQNVIFNLNGQLYPATVIAPWDGNADAYALRFGGSGAEALARHGMRASVEVQMYGGPTGTLVVANAEYDPEGKRNGTWTDLPATEPSNVVDAVTGRIIGSGESEDDSASV